MAKVTDEDLIESLENTTAPVASSKDIADRFDITRQAVHKRLQQLHDDGAIAREEIGNSVGWYLPPSNAATRSTPVPWTTPQHHPYHPDVVTDVADRHEISEEHLSDLLAACTRIMASDSEDLIETHIENYGDDSAIDEPVIAQYPDRITLFADGDALYEALDGLHITAESHRSSVIDASLRQAEHEGMEWPDPPHEYFALTLWKPGIWLCVRAGLTVPEARVQLLRHADYTPDEIQQELRLEDDEVDTLLENVSEKLKDAIRLTKAVGEMKDNFSDDEDTA